MEFYIGGYAQGKLAYVKEIHKGSKLAVTDGAELSLAGEVKTEAGARPVIDHFHLWVKRLLKAGKDPDEAAELLVGRYPDCIVISDEAGNGIVPLEKEEREYRERLGRIQIRLAKGAERVERVICGIGQRLK